MLHLASRNTSAVKFDGAFLFSPFLIRRIFFGVSCEKIHEIRHLPYPLKDTGLKEHLHKLQGKRHYTTCSRAFSCKIVQERNERAQGRAFLPSLFHNALPCVLLKKIRFNNKTMRIKMKIKIKIKIKIKHFSNLKPQTKKGGMYHGIRD